MFFLCIAFAIIIPYLICSINPAIIVTKIKSGKDIRKLGSGGAGLTNTLRTQGKTAAVIVLLGDILKGVISVLLVIGFFNILEPWTSYLENRPDSLHEVLTEIKPVMSQFLMWTASLFSVLGHCYPVYYKFKGGKAVLVTFSTGLVINWLAVIIAAVVFIAIVAITRYVSLGSMLAAIVYSVSVFFTNVYIWGYPNPFIGFIYSSVITAILIFMHKKNIIRLINKTERKLGVSERPHVRERVNNKKSGEKE